VKLIGPLNGKLLFHLGRREKNLLLALLRLYPRVPPAQARLSKSAQVDSASQQLLEEALAEQRAQNQKQVAALLSDPARWSERQGGWGLSLKPGEMEWLLQVLNDIRVGSWILLGSPEHQIAELDEETAPHLWAMEIAGTFEIPLLQALEGT
jgi:hypothetical protein